MDSVLVDGGAVDGGEVDGGEVDGGTLSGQTAGWCAIPVQPAGQLLVSDPAAPLMAGLDGSPGAELAGALERLAGVSTAEVDAFDHVLLITACERMVSWASALQCQWVAGLHARLERELRRRPDRGYGVDAGRATVHEVSAALMVSEASASNRLSLALSLVERLPATLGALRAGQLSTYKARIIDDGTQTLDDDAAGAVERAVLAKAAAQDPSTLRRAVARAAIAVDPAAARERVETAKAARRVDLFPTQDGMARLGVDLPAPAAVGIYTELSARARAAKTADHAAARAAGLRIADLDEPSMDARRADALVAAVLGVDPAPDPVPCPRHSPSCHDRPDHTAPTHPPPGRTGSGHAGPSHAGSGHTGSTREGPTPEELQQAEDLPSPRNGRTRTATRWAGAEPATGTPGSHIPGPGRGPGTGRCTYPTSTTDTGAITGTSKHATTASRPDSRHGGTQDTQRPVGWDWPSADDNDCADDDPASGGHSNGVRDGVTECTCLHAGELRGVPARQGPAARATGVSLDVVVCAETLLGLSDAPGDLARHGPITAEVVRDLAEGAPLRRLLTDTTGRLLDHDPRTYRPSASLERHVKARDQRCTFPTCNTRAARCELDHTVAFPEGQTRPDNLGADCKGHHLYKHTATVKLAQPQPGTFVWTTLAGHSYTVRPPDLREAYHATETVVRHTTPSPDPVRRTSPPQSPAPSDEDRGPPF